jgi:hypothetical protein
VTPTETHLCRGPDAGQLIGFLCSLGLLEAATRSLPEHKVRLGFEWHDVGFRPILSISPAIGRPTLVVQVHAWIARRAGSAELTRLGDDLPCQPERFEVVARDLLAAADPASTALLASLGFAGSKGFADTAFRTMSGAGHQHFLQFARRIAADTTPEHVEHCLFEPWGYGDPAPSLRFDPADDRRYALRADDPARSSSRAPIRTVRGANALAFEGLALVPVVPRSGGAATTLCERAGSSLAIVWPIWERPIVRDAAATLLAVRPRRLVPGILAIFSARRLTVGKFRSFTPAERVA